MSLPPPFLSCLLMPPRPFNYSLLYNIKANLIAGVFPGAALEYNNDMLLCETKNMFSFMIKKMGGPGEGELLMSNRKVNKY